MEHKTTTTTITKDKSSIFDKDIWESKKLKLREKFPELTNDDLYFEEGKEDGMIDKIHAKIGVAIGKTKEGLHKFIDAL